MSITPKAIQDVLDELEASKQSRLRAWDVLQRLRSVLSEAGNIAIPAPAQKTFDAEGEVLEHALTKSFRIRRGDQESVFASSAISRRHHQRSQASCHRKKPRSDIALIYRSFARKSETHRLGRQSRNGNWTIRNQPARRNGRHDRRHGG